MSHIDLNSKRCREQRIEEATKQAASLAGERKHRGTGLHAKDRRIPCEIASTLYDLGLIQQAAFSRIDFYHNEAKAAFEEIAQVKSAYQALQKELDICTYQQKP